MLEQYSRTIKNLCLCCFWHWNSAYASNTSAMAVCACLFACLGPLSLPVSTSCVHAHALSSLENVHLYLHLHAAMGPCLLHLSQACSKQTLHIWDVLLRMRITPLRCPPAHEDHTLAMSSRAYRLYRVVPAALYLQHFGSDRSHMKVHAGYRSSLYGVCLHCQSANCAAGAGHVACKRGE